MRDLLAEDAGHDGDLGCHAHAHEHEHTYFVVVFLFGTLFLGVLSRNLLQRVPVPYTGLLLIWGLLIGTLHHHDMLHKDLSKSIDMWHRMDPHLFLHIFLPALLFGSAFSMDWHILKKCIGQVLLLAGPGVVMAVTLTGVICKYMLDFGWDKSLMLGAILSATDPVAVVALLKEVGASKRLGTVIEGESLLNDGTSYVIFIIFFERVRDNYTNVDAGVIGDGLETFAQLAIGGPLVGLACGIVSVQWLLYVFNDPMVEVGITVATCYICFFVAEIYCKVSGVLAVVVLGVYMSHFGRTAISVQVEHTMHTFWELIEYFANTIVFVFSGVIIAEEGFSARDTDIVKFEDGLYAIALYVLLLFVRATVNLTMFPVLRKLGYGMTLSELAMLTWGGLRGAVGLALALMVRLDTQICDERLKLLAIVHVGAVATFTILINGTFTGQVLRRLGLTKKNRIKEVFFHQIKQDLEEYADTHCKNMRHDQVLGDPDWDVVREYTAGVNRTAEQRRLRLEKLEQRRVNLAKANPTSFRRYEHATSFMSAANSAVTAVTKAAKKAENLANVVGIQALEMLEKAAGGESSSESEAEGVPDVRAMAQQSRGQLTPAQEAEMINDLRWRFLNGVKAVYAEGFEKGYLMDVNLRELKEATDRTLDDTSHPINDWLEVERSLDAAALVPKWLTTLAEKVLENENPLLQPIKNFLAMMAFRRLLIVATSCAAYLYAHTEAQHELRRMVDDGDDKNISAEEAVADMVVHESIVMCEKASSYLAKLKLAYPEATRSVKTFQTARTVLMHKQRHIEHIAHRGLLEEKEIERLKVSTEEGIKDLLRRPLILDLPPPKELLHRFSLFRHLPEKMFDEMIMQHSHEHLIRKDEYLIKQGEEVKGVYFVVRGMLRGSLKGALFGAGNINGILEVMTGQNWIRDLIAISPVQTYYIPRDVILNVIKNNHFTEMLAWKEAAVSMICFQIPEYRAFANMTQVGEAVADGEVRTLELGDTFTVGQGHGVLLMQGRLTKIAYEGGEALAVYNPPCVIGPRLSTFEVSSAEGARLIYTRAGFSFIGGSSQHEFKLSTDVGSQLRRTTLAASIGRQLKKSRIFAHAKLTSSHNSTRRLTKVAPAPASLNEEGAS